MTKVQYNIQPRDKSHQGISYAQARCKWSKI